MPITIRNALLLVLAGTAGYFDALCYLALKVFPANMTGNTVLLSIALVQGDMQGLLNAGLALLGFVGGAAIGAWIVDPEERAGVWPLRVSRTLALEGTVLVAFALVWWAAGPAVSHPVMQLALVAIASLAMGMQSAAARRLDVSGVSTVAVTNTLTKLIAHFVAVMRRGTQAAPNQRRGLGLLAVWLVYAGGAAIAVASPRERLGALIFPAALIVMVVITSAVASRRSERRGYKG